MQRISLTMALLGLMTVLLACGGGAGRASGTPAGAATGLNTFIYIYSEN
jgi:ABC-type glycerol-3-phosphate transport system substrate-binding protein